MPKFTQPGIIVYKDKEYHRTTNGEDGDNAPLNREEVEWNQVWGGVVWYRPDEKELTEEERANLAGVHADGSPLPVHPTVGIPAPLEDHKPKSKTVAGERLPAAGGVSQPAPVGATA